MNAHATKKLSLLFAFFPPRRASRRWRKKMRKLVFSLDFVSYRFRFFFAATGCARFYLSLYLSLSLSLSLVAVPASSSPFFWKKREWDKLVNLYANGSSFVADGGGERRCRRRERSREGSRGDRGESPKISRSGSAAVYRPQPSAI